LEAQAKSTCEGQEKKLGGGGIVIDRLTATFCIILAECATSRARAIGIAPGDEFKPLVKLEDGKFVERAIEAFAWMLLS
jgi:hypothetical protein